MTLSYYEEWEQMQQKWPAYLKRGIDMLYGEYRPVEEMKAFLARWGGINLKTFVRVLSEGQDEERLLAICVIGESSLPRARALLLPFLSSDLPQALWISAIYLGRKKEKQALPILITMLTEYLPSKEFPIPDNMLWFDELRVSAASTLMFWNDASLVAAYRRAFLTSVNAEQYLPDHPVKRRIILYNWFGYQDKLSYALGRKGAFGALIGLPLSPCRQRIAMIKMVIGYKQVLLHTIDNRLVYSWEQNEELKTTMKAVLEQRFGLSKEEQEEALNQFKQDIADRESSLIRGEPTT